MELFTALSLALLLIIVCIYFVPSIIATSRDHRNVWGVFVLNLTLGWTWIGWVAALIWAIHNDAKA